MPGFRLLLDQRIPRDTAALLREVGFECVHVGEIGMSRAEDREILILASEQRATVVTLDADFHALLAVTSAAGPSVIRIRIQGLHADAVGGLVQKVMDRYSNELESGALVTVRTLKTPCHRLPIGGLD